MRRAGPCSVLEEPDVPYSHLMRITLGAGAVACGRHGHAPADCRPHTPAPAVRMSAQLPCPIPCPLEARSRSCNAPGFISERQFR
jgi:hypothetical protein